MVRHPESPRFLQRAEGSRARQRHSTRDPSLRLLWDGWCGSRKKFWVLIFLLAAVWMLVLMLLLLGSRDHSSRGFYPHSSAPVVGRGACWCPIVMKGRCYLKTGLEGPRRRSQSPERELAM